MPRYRMTMTFDLVTDESGTVESAAHAAYGHALDLAHSLGGEAEGIDASAVTLGLCTLLEEALYAGVHGTLPDDPQVQGLAVSAQAINDQTSLG